MQSHKSLSIDITKTTRPSRRVVSNIIFLILAILSTIIIITALQRTKNTAKYAPDGTESYLRIPLHTRSIPIIHELLGNTVIDGTTVSVNSLLRNARGEISLFFSENSLIGVTTSQGRFSVMPYKKQRNPFLIAKRAYYANEDGFYPARFNQKSIRISNIGQKSNSHQYLTPENTEIHTFINFDIKSMSFLPNATIHQFIWGQGQDDEFFSILFTGAFSDEDLANFLQKTVQSSNLSTLALTLSDGTTIKEIRSNADSTHSSIENIEDGLILGFEQGNISGNIVKTGDLHKYTNRAIIEKLGENKPNGECTSRPHSMMVRKNHVFDDILSSSLSLVPEFFTPIKSAEFKGNDLILCINVDN